MCAGPGSMKISVDAAQSITSRSTCFSSRKRLMSSRIALSIERLSIGVDHVVGVEPLHVSAVERGRHRPHVAQRFGDALEVAAGLEHAGPLGGDVGVVGERIPCAEHDVVEVGDRYEVLDERPALVGALAEADRVHQRQRADRVGHAALDELDAGDRASRRRRRDRRSGHRGDRRLVATVGDGGVVTDSEARADADAVVPELSASLEAAASDERQDGRTSRAFACDVCHMGLTRSSQSPIACS